MNVPPTIPRDRISSDEYRGLDRLDRDELDEEDGDRPRSDWDDNSAVRKLASSPPPPGTPAESEARVA
jgi:hypothetical protein